MFETVDDQVDASASWMEALICKTVGDQVGTACLRRSVSMRSGLKPQKMLFFK